MNELYDHAALTQLAIDLMVRLGFPADSAQATAQTLVEADLMNHTTHGLALLDAYLKDAENGGLRKEGSPEVVQDTGAAVTWDGQYLSGPWLVHQAMELAFERIAQHPVVSVAIRKSHHIGCLAAYPERATRRNLMMLLSCSDPRNATVAPYGGMTGVYSPNPLAAGIPTHSDPIILDISMSSTANGLVNQKIKAGEPLPQQWLLNNQGKPTDDPRAFLEDPPATILPLGGMETGYKGFGLGLLVDILTSGLAGHGRADHPTNWGASVFLQVINPEAFGGIDRFKVQAQHLVDACMASTPYDVEHPVRIPGHRALKMRDQRKKEGVPLDQDIVQSLRYWAEKTGLEMDRYGL